MKTDPGRICFVLKYPQGIHILFHYLRQIVKRKATFGKISGPSSPEFFRGFRAMLASRSAESVVIFLATASKFKYNLQDFLRKLSWFYLLQI